MHRYDRPPTAEGAKSFLLEFDDKNLESDFWTEMYRAKKGFIEKTILITILALLLTSVLAMPSIPKELVIAVGYNDMLARSALLLPLLLVAFMASRLRESYQLTQNLLIIAGAACGLCFSTLMLLSSSKDGAIFYNYAFMHVILFMFIFFILPTKKVFPITLFMVACHLLFGALATKDLPTEEVFFIITPCITIFIILSYAGHSLEKSERSSFLLGRAFNAEFENKVQLQEQRSRWLGLVTDFLRHELKNSLIGVTSSLELISRKNHNDDLDNYIQRAGNSTNFMKRLLDEASTSTSIEAALKAIHLEELNVSSLLGSKVEEYRDVYDGYSFDTDIDENIYASLDPDRMGQALDKLINNAVEHCDPGHPITVCLSGDSNNAHIKVSNIGDPIKDGADIFQPFVSDKSSISNDNFGLGLFVVKRIVEAHGGTVSSRGLQDPDGAEFTLSLPV